LAQEKIFFKKKWELLIFLLFSEIEDKRSRGTISTIATKIKEMEMNILEKAWRRSRKEIMNLSQMKEKFVAKMQT
jgi:hypothetical protein